LEREKGWKRENAQPWITPSLAAATANPAKIFLGSFLVIVAVVAIVFLLRLFVLVVLRPVALNLTTALTALIFVLIPTATTWRRFLLFLGVALGLATATGATSTVIVFVFPTASGSPGILLRSFLLRVVPATTAGPGKLFLLFVPTATTRTTGWPLLFLITVTRTA